MEKVALLSDLLKTVREFVEKQGYVKTTRYLYIAGINHLRRCFEQREQTLYSSNIAWECVVLRRERYERGKIAYNTFLYTWKVFTMLEECYLTGSVTRRYSSAWNHKRLSAEYKQLLDEYERKKLSDGYSINTLRGQRSAIRQFLFFMEESGIFHISEIKRTNISEYIPILAEGNPSGIAGVLSRLRTFFRYLIEVGLVNEKLIYSLQVTAAIHKKVRFGFTPEEAHRILGAVDRSIAVGKRDYAILMLARYTGLRGIDILKLQMQDVDWRNGEIRIIQHKTQRALILPMENHVGNAIADYILNARPDSNSAYIFLRTRAPYEPLGHGNGSIITRKYAQRAGVQWRENEYKGLHSFRRSIGTDLLSADVPVHMISEILGHSSSASTKPYLSADLEHLKLCALPLEGFECRKEGLS